MVQYALPAQPTVHNKVDHLNTDNSARTEKTPKSTNFEKPKKCEKPKTHASTPFKSRSKCIEDHLASLKTTLIFVLDMPASFFATRPTYHLRASYGIATTALRAAHCFLDRKAGVNLTWFSIASPIWTYRIKRDELPTLWTATKEPLSMHASNLLTLRTNNLNTRVWLKMTSHLAVDILLNTAFNDHWIVVRWHSKPFAITIKPETSETAWLTILIADKPVAAANHSKAETDPIYHVSPGAKQIEQQPYTRYLVFATTHSCGLLTIEPINLRRHSTLLARSLIEVSPEQPFNVIVCIFSNQKVHLPKQMVIAYTAEPPNVFHVIGCKEAPIGISEVDRNLFKNWVSPSNMNDKNTEELFAVLYNFAVDRKTQMSRETLI